MVSLQCEMDPLCCQENWEPIEEDDDADGRDLSSSPAIKQPEDDLGVFFASLASRESELRRRRRRSGSPDDDPYLVGGGRREAVGWVLRAAARHGFSPATAVLAADYLDRCFLSGGGGGLQLQVDRPWMARLSAVGCLSLAAKVEETRVPFFVDLQTAVADDDEEEEASPGSAAVGGRCGYLFEPRTVRRMELLVLSALQWRMSSVTPFSFLLPLLAGPTAAAAAGKRELLMCCEDVLLSAVADGRWVGLLPSVWAAAALLHTAGVDDADRLMNLANSHKESVRECFDLVGELMGRSSNTRSAARRLCGISSNSCGAFGYSCRDCSCSPSPTGVIESCFSHNSCCSSSSLTAGAGGDSRTSWPSSISSPDHLIPPLKKPKL